MARGLGAIMALVAMAQKEIAIKNLEAPACPLCGGAMQNDGAGWFCYNGENNQCPEIGHAGDLYRKAGAGYADEFQGETLAAIVEDGQPVVRLKTVRGPNAKTNLRIFAEIPDEEIPAFIATREWVWQDWLSEYDKGN